MLTKTITPSPEALNTLLAMSFETTDSPQKTLGKIGGGQLDRKLYVEVNKCLEALGGKWNKKLGGHIFDTDPQSVISGLAGAGKLTVAKDGYFPTPGEVVLKMIAYANLLTFHIVLEPSAGTGNIADVVKSHVSEVHVIEKDPKRLEVLKSKGYKAVGEDFLQFTGKYERILMNPPFEDGQDVTHVEHAFDCLLTGGICVAIMSAGISFRQDSKYKNFRDDILEHYGYDEPLPAGAFKDSGTMVNARIVVLTKG